MRCLLAFAVAAVVACSSSAKAPTDGTIDTANDPCALCASGQICVAKYDGVCNGQATCVAKTVDCPLNACTPACEAAYCGAPPYQCKTRSPCGGESPSAFTCYGP